MFRFLSWLAALAVVSTCVVPAKADMIVGSIGFNVEGTITPTSGSLNQAFTLTDVRTNNTADGDWTAFINGVPVDTSINVGAFNSVGQVFNFSSTSFGTFTGSVIDDSGQVGTGIAASRSISVLGLFTPGTLLVASGYNEVVQGQLLVSLENISGGGRSANMIFGTQAVPEPSSCVLCVLGIGGWFAARRRRSACQRTGRQ